MMNIEQVRDYVLSLYGVTEDQAFGEDIVNFRLEGKIFVCLWLGGGKHDMKESPARDWRLNCCPNGTRSCAHNSRPCSPPGTGTRNTGATCISSKWRRRMCKPGFKSPIGSWRRSYPKRSDSNT